MSLPNPAPLNLSSLCIQKKTLKTKKKKSKKEKIIILKQTNIIFKKEKKKQRKQGKFPKKCPQKIKK